MPIISILLLIPLLGILVIVAAPVSMSRRVGLVFSGATLAMSGWLLTRFNRGGTGLQFEETIPWIPSLGISYHVGVDQLSILFVILTTLITFLSLLASPQTIAHPKAYSAAFLLLLSLMLGVFVAHDLFLFYLFWEAALFPLYVIIVLWGGKQSRFAALKMFLYTLLGSIFMLIGIIMLAVFTVPHSFDLADISAVREQIPPDVQLWIALLLGIGFAVKLPVVPFHTWLPAAHVEAPTAGSMVLAGVLLKMGGYGFLRLVVELLPDAMQVLSFPLLILGFVNIIYGALLALAQSDIKKIVAYSSISHMGFVLIGIASLTAVGIEGAIFQMIAHGITAPALFFAVGMLYSRTHTRELADYGGVATKLPAFAVFFTLMCFASMGLPGLIGFVGEFASLFGAYLTYSWWVILGGVGVFLAGVYMLRLLQGVLWGTVTKTCESLTSLTRTEMLLMIVFAILVLGGGVLPMSILQFCPNLFS